MPRRKELFREIEYHLMNDAAPSEYLNDIFRGKELKEYPFSMIYALKSTEQSKKYHPEGDVFNHTVLVTDEAAKVRHKSQDPRAFMWAALLHDIGKASTTKIRKGRVTAYDHDKAGEKLAREFLGALTEEAEFIRAVAMLVRYHMQMLFVLKDLPFADTEGMRRNTDIGETALLGYCDRLGRTGANRREEEENMKAFIKKCGKINTEGNDIMSKAGMRRPDPKDSHGTESNRKGRFPKNDREPVPEIQGKAKNSKEKADPP